MQRTANISCIAGIRGRFHHGTALSIYHPASLSCFLFHIVILPFSHFPHMPLHNPSCKMRSHNRKAFIPLSPKFFHRILLISRAINPCSQCCMNFSSIRRLPYFRRRWVLMQFMSYTFDILFIIPSSKTAFNNREANCTYWLLDNFRGYIQNRFQPFPRYM